MCPEKILSACFPLIRKNLNYLQKDLEDKAGCKLGIIATDTEVRLMRCGSNEVALAWSGFQPISTNFGSSDMYGNPKFGGVDAVADQLVNAAALLMGQNDEKVPVANKGCAV